MAKSLADMLKQKQEEAKNTPVQEAQKEEEKKEEQEAKVFVAQNDLLGYQTYKAIRANKLILANGTKVFPINGVFTPTSAEEVEILEYWVSKDNGMVEKV